MEARLLAVGPWSRGLDAIRGGISSEASAGTTVVIDLIYVADFAGSADCEALADALGVGLWDLGEHRLDPERIDLRKLRKVEGVDPESGDVEIFLLLKEQGFAFYLLVEEV
jgi:hypothetical protein